MIHFYSKFEQKVFTENGIGQKMGTNYPKREYTNH
jgi:hypothetical protein